MRGGFERAMTITVEVTQRNIEEGIRLSCAGCPVALAMNRATGLEWSISGWQMMAFRKLEKDALQTYALVTPPIARAFISAFDIGRPVEPFSFDLDLPDTIVAAMIDKVKA